MEDKNPQEFLFDSALKDFLIELDGLNVSVPVMMESIGKLRRDTSKEVYKFLTEKGEYQFQEEIDGKKLYHLSLDYHYEFLQLRRNANNYKAATRIMPGSFLVTMVSQYDAFLGRIIRAMFYAKPELIDASERNLKFAELLQFGSIEAAREAIVEKEVEAVLRESHSDHFDWLEKKIGMPLRKDLDIWSDFIELTERRNLFVHTGGVVSSQYLNVCRKHGIAVDQEYKIGIKINVSKNYFQKATNILYELAVKLSQVIWRKLLPAQIHHADIFLNNICYSLLKQENYSLANRILSFALSLPKHELISDKLVFTINNAIALKWGGEPEKAKKLLTEMDWSAYRDEFILTSKALLDDFDSASEIMRRIGKNGNIGKSEYKDWPAFKEFRKSPEFCSAYEEIFEEPFETILISEETTSDGIIETTATVVEDIDSDPVIEDSNSDKVESPLEVLDGAQ